MNLYYHALYEDPRIATNMVNAVSDNLSKFDRYLNLAIKSLKDKKHIKARWDKVEDPTVLNFKPLVYEITVSSSTEIEVYMEERYLELEVTNSVPFDPSQGIRLDNNWVPILPEQFKLITLSNNKYLISLNDWSIYKGEKSALTIDGSIAKVSEFDIKWLSQKDKHVDITSLRYDQLRECYSFTIKGDVDDDEDLLVSGLFIDQNNWCIVSSNVEEYKNEKGQLLPIKAKEVNKFYIDKSFPKPLEVYQGSSKINYTIRDPKVPNQLGNGEEEIHVDSDRGIFTTLGNTSFLKNGYEEIHPLLGIPLFRVNIQTKKVTKNGHGKLAIRLRDEDDESEFLSKSNIDYFFDQDVDELEGIINRQLIKLQIVPPSNEDERILYVKSAFNKGSFTYEDIPEVLSIRVNTYQLEMQIKSLQKLRNKPLHEHEALIKLSQKKSMSQVWPDSKLEEIETWCVLTDSDREGIESQRNFVKKAISTPDFALLEGPPGSGKTTTILELILQLVKQGKRILLCGSTHVAIDNVLERLKVNKLMDGISPLRIGDMGSVKESVQEFCINNYTGHEYDRLMIESSNLVCGTTIGILKHPLFNLQSDEPPVPYYDYLIIDESSKTTFQEFLIPALYTKKWVLVGDIKQLPPFNDREQIIAGIDDNDKLKPPLKRAALLIYQYIYNFKVKMPVCIVESEEVIKEVQKELIATKTEDIKKRIAVIDKEFLSDSDAFASISEENIQRQDHILWGLNGINVIFVNEKIFNQIELYIPTNMVVLSQHWEDSDHRYQVNAYYDEYPKNLNKALEFTWKHNRHRDKLPIDFLYEQQKFLKERSWSSEYGWRLVRMFELENVENSNTRENYKKQLELLAPKSASAYSLSAIKNVSDIALPSILQALQDGVGKNREKSLVTTLNSGFNEKEKSSRFVTLDYQHRMHPDISDFPRKQFYNETSLLNSKFVTLKRQWTYDRYQSRSIWLDVNGKMKRSSNEAEVKAIMKELQHFISWAKYQFNEDHEKGRWEVACLSFYNGQRKLFAEKLKKLSGQTNKISNFQVGNVDIKNYTVDKFQGQEADITFLSMVRTERGMGFMDNPNRLNVGITRAKYQRVIVGKYHYFLNNNRSEQLQVLPRESVRFTNY
ncbi:AAA domain-containing protein [Halobacillus sp. A1]|uniref:AAA domain-containing protein n=1 Tax=Halobacillus sp. A1 TaxID=2880262 RepID=UPI0020A6BA30|nr:AAA domain-containing protein [Halobacillus sp. A1]MCP3032912.1 AAA domain-containing protein [Halobacillus sp. A1]